MQIVPICSVKNIKSSEKKKKLTTKLMKNLCDYLKSSKQIAKTQHMTSSAQINPYFHVEDKAEDVLEAHLTV